LSERFSQLSLSLRALGDIESYANHSTDVSGSVLKWLDMRMKMNSPPHPIIINKLAAQCPAMRDDSGEPGIIRLIELGQRPPNDLIVGQSERFKRLARDERDRQIPVCCP
jgi:hypothetical protein